MTRPVLSFGSMAFGALLLVVGCSNEQDPGEVVAADESAEATQGGWFTGDRTVEVVDDDGYSYQVSFEARISDPTLDVTNAKPGESYLGGSHVGAVAITNVTSARTVGVRAGDVTVAFFYPRSGAQAQCWPRANIGDETGYPHCVAGVVFGFTYGRTSIASGDVLRPPVSYLMPLLGTENAIEELSGEIEVGTGFTGSGLIMSEASDPELPEFQLAAADSDSCEVALLYELDRGNANSRKVSYVAAYGVVDSAGAPIC